MSEQIINRRAVENKLQNLEQEIKDLRSLLFAPDLSGEDTLAHPYIERVPTILSGEPIIKGSRTPVRAIVEYWKFGMPPEEIARRLPHLRLAQIFDALAYYDDNRQEIEQFIALNQVPVDD